MNKGDVPFRTRVFFESVIFPYFSVLLSPTKKRCKLKAISGVAILRDAGTSTPTSSAGATKVGVRGDGRGRGSKMRFLGEQKMGFGNANECNTKEKKKTWVVIFILEGVA